MGLEGYVTATLYFLVYMCTALWRVLRINALRIWVQFCLRSTVQRVSTLLPNLDAEKPSMIDRDEGFASWPDLAVAHLSLVPVDTYLSRFHTSFTFQSLKLLGYRRSVNYVGMPSVPVPRRKRTDPAVDIDCVLNVDQFEGIWAEM